MNESEIALKTAEIALSKAKTEFFSDALKIGIPSIVAIAGIISTYLLTKLGHKKDLEIEALRASNETQNEINTRTGDLIRSITLNLSKLHQEMLLYTSNLYAKLDVEKDGLQYPEENRKELSVQYQAFVNILHDVFSIEAQILLLGQKNIDENFTNYQSALTELSMNFVPWIKPDMQEALQHRLSTMRDLREILFQSLSKVYLIN
ncbi:MAG: hypothetical protein GC149_04465 [Gammaproteobacteria bacterium]|nr:hypothetical protein [Gammaproteobacteria bacterium]